MKKEKSNIDHVRDLLKTVVHVDMPEIMEFLDATEEEIANLKSEIADFGTVDPEEDEDDDEDDEPEYDNTEHLGLDTFHWSLETGNIIIEQHVEEFVNQMKRKYAMLPA